MTGAFTNYHNKQQTYFDYLKHKGIVAPVLSGPQLNTPEKSSSSEISNKIPNNRSVDKITFKPLNHNFKISFSFQTKFQTRGDLVPFLVGKS